MSFPDVRYAGGPTYTVIDSINRFFPFKYNNGILDLPSGFVGNGILPRNDGAHVRRLGGVNVITGLGPNFIAYLKSVAWSTHGRISDPIKIELAGIVTKVQPLSTNLPSDFDVTSYEVSTEVPANFIGNEGSTWLFDKPLVVSGKKTNGDKVYITFITYWGQ